MLESEVAKQVDAVALGSGARARLRAIVTVTSAFTLLAACSAEKRPAGPSQPQTAPNGPNDPRIADFESNAYQLGQGGRYFSWYGCAACHSNTARGALDLADNRWAHGGSFEQVYRSVAAHPGLASVPGDIIPPEQLWQLTAYVRSLSELDPAKRRRQDFDAAGEPQADNWSGPIK
jgi:cytochrome c oxidase cbb3-type subunit 3